MLDQANNCFNATKIRAKSFIMTELHSLSNISAFRLCCSAANHLAVMLSKRSICFFRL
jgi:hypothetical protein